MENRYVKIGSLKNIEAFRSHISSLGLGLECDDSILPGPESPLANSFNLNGFRIGNRFAIHPMEGWDAGEDGNPSPPLIRRWVRFGQSGAKLIWGGEAVAVRHEARANPNQLYFGEHTRAGLARLFNVLSDAHRERFGNTDDLLVGLQLTDSGRFSKPNRKDRMEPRVLYRHPILDRKFHLSQECHVLTDGEIREVISDYVRAGRAAQEIGFHFVDIKHCHGYLGHEFLSAHTRRGDFGGPFDNRTRFLQEVVAGIRSEAPGLMIGVRLSAFDLVPYRPDPELTSENGLGPGIPEDYSGCLPYRYGFGVNEREPVKIDLTETYRFMDLLRSLNIELVNITAGSPYYNPHIQRPAYYPPSDGYQPPEDPLVGVWRQIEVTKRIKFKYPDLPIVGTGYSYLQEYLPHVAQHVVRDGGADFVGIGRMVLSYHDLPHDTLAKGTLDLRRLCRTFSDCTTAPRNGLRSGCYPLDTYYKKSPEAKIIRTVKKKI